MSRGDIHGLQNDEMIPDVLVEPVSVLKQNIKYLPIKYMKLYTLKISMEMSAKAHLQGHEKSFVKSFCIVKPHVT